MWIACECLGGAFTGAVLSGGVEGAHGIKGGCRGGVDARAKAREELSGSRGTEACSFSAGDVT